MSSSLSSPPKPLETRSSDPTHPLSKLNPQNIIHPPSCLLGSVRSGRSFVEAKKASSAVIGGGGLLGLEAAKAVAEMSISLYSRLFQDSSSRHRHFIPSLRLSARIDFQWLSRILLGLPPDACRKKHQVWSNEASKSEQGIGSTGSSSNNAQGRGMNVARPHTMQASWLVRSPIRIRRSRAKLTVGGHCGLIKTNSQSTKQISYTIET